MTDEVNHPSHYNSHPSGVECITITEHMTFNVGNAIKYLWRAGLKMPQPMKDAAATEMALRAKEKHLEDLRKAGWYIAREIQRIEDDHQRQQVVEFVKKVQDAQKSGAV